MSANFIPNMREYKNTGTFKFWCQKVLPLVYDDSLSYYELLCKVVNYLNDVIQNSDVLDDNVKGLYNAYVQLQDYVNSYYDSDDFAEIINNKLDSMADDGTLTSLIAPFLPFITPQMFGAKGDGENVVEIFNRIFSENIGKNFTLLIPTGVYDIGENFVFPENATLFFVGGMLKGENITINGCIMGGKYKIFDTTTEITTVKQAEGSPEWFGALPNNGVVDNAPFINLCIKSFVVCKLSPCDYFVASNVVIDRTNHTLEGNSFGGYEPDAKHCSRIVLTNHNCSVIVGSQTFTTLDAMPRCITVKNLLVNGLGAYATGSESTGVYCRYSISSLIENVRAIECNFNFRFNGTVTLTVENCSAFNTTGFSRGAVRSFYIDGNNNSIGLAGANASLRLKTCNAGQGITNGSAGDSIGFYAEGSISDTFIDGCETADFNIGMSVTSSAERVVDFIITKGIFDRNHNVGLYFNVPNKSNSISVSECYINSSPDCNFRVLSIDGYGVTIENSLVLNQESTANSIGGTFTRCSLNNISVLSGNNKIFITAHNSNVNILGTQNILTDNFLQTNSSTKSKFSVNVISESNTPVFNSNIIDAHLCSDCTFELGQLNTELCVNGKNGTISFNGTPYTTDVETITNFNGNLLIGIF